MAQAIPFVVSGLQAIGGGSAATGAALAASTAAAVGGTVASISSQRKATRAQEKADAVGRATDAIKNQRAIRQQILRARAAQAQTIAAGQAQTGGFSSSGVQGAVSSIGAQGASNVGFANTQQGAGNAISELTSQARGYASNAQTFGAISALPGQFGWDIGSVFKQGTDKMGGSGIQPIDTSAFPARR